MKHEDIIDDLMEIYKTKHIGIESNDNWLWSTEDEDIAMSDVEYRDFESIATRLMDELAAHKLDVLVAMKDPEIGEWWGGVTKHRRILAERERQLEEERRKREEDDRALKE